MHYLVTRLRALMQQLMTPRGALIALVVIAWLLAVVTSSPWSEVFAVLGLGVLAALLLIISARQADTHDQLANPPPTGAGAQPLTMTPDRVGPTMENRQDFRLAAARAQIGATRQSMAIEATRRPLSPPARNDALEVIEGVSTPTITVVVPCFNEERFVAEALESVRRQSFTDWECLVVDDASTDRSVTQIWRYVGADRRFRLIRHKANSGLSAARNTGLRAARGRYVTFLDGDDLLMADSLLDRVEKLAQVVEPDVAGVYCDVELAVESVSLDALSAWRPGTRDVTLDFVSSGGECPFNVHVALVRAEVLRMAGGFDEGMRDGAEDWDLWYRIMRNGYRFQPTGNATAIYRQKRHSMAKANATEHVREARRLTDSAYAEVDPQILWESGLVPFDRPLPEYERQVTIAKRVIHYATRATLDGNIDIARGALASLEALPPSILHGHVQPEQRIDDGFRTVLGLDIAEFQELDADLQPIKQALLQEVQEAFEPPKTVHPELTPPSYDVVFAPQTLDHARLMLRIADVVGRTHSTAFLLTDRISGTQGAAEALEETDATAFTLDTWALKAGTAAVLVIAFPREAAIAEVAAAFSNRGGLVVNVTRPADDILIVDDSPQYDTPTTMAAVDDADEIIGEALAHNGQRVAIATQWSLGPMVWTGVATKDPDQAYAVEEDPDTIFDATRLRAFKDTHRGERCVIIGNGPSLNDLDLRKLANESTIGVNGIFYAAEEMGFDPTYYVVEDTMVMQDNLEAIRDYRAGHKFFPSIYRNQVGTADNVSYFMMNRGYYQGTSPSFCVPRFSTDITQRMFSGQSVTIINLQLAYYMGFEEVVLIGMDFSYTIPADSIVEGNHVLSQGDDPNHFHPDYFGKGKVWKDPKLDRVLANYQLAKLIYEADGRRIVNATAGGKLELFERIPYEELFG